MSPSHPGRRVLTLGALWLACSVAGAGDAVPSGSWHGSSLCTDLKTAPGCQDEQVVYVFTGAGSGKVHISADKLVGGQRENMGEFDLVPDAGDGGAWVYDFTARGAAMRWRFVVRGARLDGELLAMPARTRIRQVQATPGATF